jgi:hypothetical protein
MVASLFTGIKQWEFEWQGHKATLPVFYYDNSSLTAIYTADTAEVKKLLPLRDMNPIEFLPGKSLVAFTAFEYRKTDIDPYNEVSIAFLVSFRKPQVPGVTALTQLLRRCFTAYVWQLPVTTEIARAGGVDLYGYPKFIAEIEFKKGSEWWECSLSEKGEKILDLKGRVLRTAPARTTRYITYSVLDNIPLVANVFIRPLQFGQSRNGSDAEVTLGTHRIAGQLKTIGLSERPIIYQFAPRTEAVLFAGRNLIDN